MKNPAESGSSDSSNDEVFVKDLDEIDYFNSSHHGDPSIFAQQIPEFDLSKLVILARESDVEYWAGQDQGETCFAINVYVPAEQQKEGDPVSRGSGNYLASHCDTEDSLSTTGIRIDFKSDERKISAILVDKSASLDPEQWHQITRNVYTQE